jgi:(4S)-4-hydroxy-5-phosphonooxypentane-2,3-dione isomerase
MPYHLRSVKTIPGTFRLTRFLQPLYTARVRPRLALLVAIKIKPGYRDQFVNALMDDAKGSVNNEPGCLRFDVLQDSENPDRIYLYEVYKDEKALEAHRAAPHFTTWRETVKDWFDGEPMRHICSTVFPTEDAWKAVKP